jgi:hypothetical protein
MALALAGATLVLSPAAFVAPAGAEGTSGAALYALHCAR